MKNIIYTVCEDWANDYGDNGINFTLFKDRNDAFDYFTRCIKDNENFVETENPIIDSNESLFEIYEEGYYFCNHYRVEVIEKEVK